MAVFPIIVIFETIEECIVIILFLILNKYILYEYFFYVILIKLFIQ